MDPKTLAIKYKLDGPGVSPGATGKEATTKLEDILSQVIGVISLVAFIYFAIQIILAGFKFISAQGDTDKLKTARKQITQGILGLTIIVLAMGIAALLANIMGIENIFDLDKTLQNFGF